MHFSARTPVRAVLIAVALSTLAGCSSDVPAASPTTPLNIPTNADTIGRTLPDVGLKSTRGETVSTASLRGRPLVVNFWYSTCEPCRREMPALAAAYNTFGDRVDFIGVNMSDPAIVAQNFADRYGVTFPILLDNESMLTLELGIAIAQTTLFIDANGTIVEQVSGELSADEMAMHLSDLVTS